MKPARLLLLFLLTPAILFSQSIALQGEWKGAIQTPGSELGIELQFKKEGKKDYSGTLDVPQQQLAQLPLTELEFNPKDGKLRYSVPDVPGNAHFKGKVIGDSITGSWIQNGFSMPTWLRRPDPNAQQELALNQEEKLAEFRAYVDSLLKSYHVPATGIAVVADGEVVLAEGFGYRDLEKKTPANETTLFCIGSCSKAFTATGLGILADDGKLDWERPVREYLPDFRMQDPFATEHLNAIDLLCHRSGLPRHDLSWIGAPATREELFARIPYLEPNESFRSTWQYQNYMFMTAGILGGKLYGSSWENLIKERIFTPLGMDLSNLSKQEWMEVKNRALPYKWVGDEGRYQKLTYRNIDAIGPAGSINSCAQDMAQWLLFQVANGRYKGKPLLSNQEVQRQRNPLVSMGRPGQEPLISPPSYGLGWMTFHYQGHHAINHGGNIDGFSAEVFAIPSERFAIAVLTNLDGTRFPSAVCFEAADIFLDLKRNDWAGQLKGIPGADGPELGEEKPIAGTVPGHPLEHYVGTYSHPAYGKLVVELRSDTLYSLYNGFEFPMEHWHYDIFSVFNSYISMQQKYNFRTGSDGYIESVEVPMELGIDDIEFEMLPPPRLSEPEFMGRLAGKYDVEVFTASIELEGEHLVVKAPNQPDYILEPLRGTQYKFKDLNGFSIEFFLDEEGNAEEILVRQPGATIRGKRVE